MTEGSNEAAKACKRRSLEGDRRLRLWEQG